MDIEKEINTCRYFNGIQNKRCKNSIPYDDVRDEEQRTWACFAYKQPNATCQYYQGRTREEIETRRHEAYDHAMAYVEKAKNWVCPICDQPIQREDQVGHCVYAAPCGHRLWQGTARGRRPETEDGKS